MFYCYVTLKNLKTLDIITDIIEENHGPDLGIEKGLDHVIGKKDQDLEIEKEDLDPEKVENEGPDLERTGNGDLDQEKTGNVEDLDLEKVVGDQDQGKTKEIQDQILEILHLKILSLETYLMQKYKILLDSVVLWLWKVLGEKLKVWSISLN